MKTPDITYAEQGLFVAFYPETEAGREAWGEIVSHTGCHRIIAVQAGEVIGKLAAAGYVLRKSEPAGISDDELLSQLAE